MKTSYFTVHRAVQISICATFGLGIAMAQTPATTKSTETPPKTHVLFMGADLSVEKDKTFHPVEDVTPTDLLIKSAGKPVKVPMDQSAQLQISETLKIAATSVVIESLVTERAYTPWADPFRKIAQASALSMDHDALMDIAHEKMMRAYAGRAAGGGDTPTDPMEAYLKVAETPNLDPSNLVSQSTAVDDERYDAIRLSFEVRPEKNLVQPYFAFIALIRDPGSKPGQVRKWAYVRSIGPISAGSSRKVSVFQGGMTPGYILESCEVHAYDHGEELATNLSRKTVPLTDEEAHDFRVIEYISANKGRSLPVAIAMNVIAADLYASFTPAQLGKTHYLRVGKDGRVHAVFSDAAAKQVLEDPALETALKTLRFKPALQQGKPVESIAPVRLGQPKP